MKIKISNKPAKTFLMIRQSAETVHLRPEMVEYCNSKKDFPFVVNPEQEFFYLLDVVRLAGDEKYLVGLNLHLIKDKDDTQASESIVICKSKKELLNELRLPSILFGSVEEHVFIYEGKFTASEDLQKIITEWQDSIK